MRLQNSKANNRSFSSSIHNERQFVTVTVFKLMVYSQYVFVFGRKYCQNRALLWIVALLLTNRRLWFEINVTKVNNGNVLQAGNQAYEAMTPLVYTTLYILSRKNEKARKFCKSTSHTGLGQVHNDYNFSKGKVLLLTCFTFLFLFFVFSFNIKSNAIGMKRFAVRWT